MTKKPKINEQLIRDVIASIEAEPENWDQTQYIDVPYDQPPCKTTLCFAGWAAAISMGPERFFKKILKESKWRPSGWTATYDVDIPDIARKALGFTYDQADEIFYFMTQDVNQLKRKVTEVTGVKF